MSWGKACLLVVLTAIPQVVSGAEYWRRDRTPLTIPDAGPSVQRDFVVSNLPTDAWIDYVEAGFRCVHPFAENLTVRLRNPTGITFDLWSQDGGESDDPEWQDYTTLFSGANHLLGTWSFVVQDWTAGNVGYLDSCWFRVYFFTTQGAFVWDAGVTGFQSFEDRDGDLFHERFLFTVSVDANYIGTGTRGVDGVLYTPTLDEDWDWPSWSITGLSNDPQAQQYSQNSFLNLDDEYEVDLGFWLYDLPTAQPAAMGGTLWDVEEELAGEPVRLEPSLPVMVNATVNDVWYDLPTDFDGDGHYEEFTYQIWVVADAAPNTIASVSAVIRCIQTNEEYVTPPWTIYSNDRLPQKFYFDENSFPGFTNNTSLTFEVEFRGGTGHVALGSGVATGQAILADNNQTPPFARIFGYVRYLDEDHQSKPVRFARIEIVDTATGPFDPVVRPPYVTHTDGSGFYEAWISNNLDGDGTGADVIVRTLCVGTSNATSVPGQTHEIARVVSYPNTFELRGQSTPPQDHLNNMATELQIDIIAPNNSLLDGEFAVYDASIEAFLGAYSVLGITMPGPIEIWWSADDAGLTLYQSDSWPLSPAMHVIRGDRWNEVTLMHEYGHFIMDVYDIADGDVGNAFHWWSADLRYWVPVGQPNRTLEQARHLAFREALPTWFAMSVQAAAGRGTTYRKILPSSDNAGNYSTDYSFDVDAITGGFPSGCLSTSCDTGETVEYLTLATLWDIHDNVNHQADNSDLLWLGPEEIWATANNEPVDDIVGFWNEWFNGFGNAILMTRVFQNHKMKFIPISVPPTNPTPTDAATNQATNVTLRWSTVPGAESYDVYAGTSGHVCNYPNLAYCQLLGSTTSAMFELPTPPAPNSFFDWRVVAKANNAEIAGSPWYFVTGDCECDVECLNDPVCDSVVSDILDVIRVVNVAFRGWQVTQVPGCELVSADMNCDGFPDVLDVIAVVNVAFRGFTSSASYCWDVRCASPIANR